MYDQIIGTIFIIIGTVMITLNKYFVAYMIEINRRFIRLFTKDTAELNKRYVRISYSLIYYLAGIIIISAGWIILRSN
ncbi:MAG: hypothetical protein QS99_C0002G0018 [archaeon GW2011_AR4]|nr:MAG: hypothetical protein QS99_C0002G0018 [archaeon GW2011_AR4]